jgi:hypothetical protein
VEVDKADKANNGYDYANTNEKHDKPLANNHEEIGGSDVENRIISLIIKMIELIGAIRLMMSKQIYLFMVVLKRMMHPQPSNKNH